MSSYLLIAEVQTSSTQTRTPFNEAVFNPIAHFIMAPCFFSSEFLLMADVTKYWQWCRKNTAVYCLCVSMHPDSRSKRHHGVTVGLWAIHCVGLIAVGWVSSDPYRSQKAQHHIAANKTVMHCVKSTQKHPTNKFFKRSHIFPESQISRDTHRGNKMK